MEIEASRPSVPSDDVYKRCTQLSRRNRVPDICNVGSAQRRNKCFRFPILSAINNPTPRAFTARELDWDGALEEATVGLGNDVTTVYYIHVEPMYVE